MTTTTNLAAQASDEPMLLVPAKLVERIVTRLNIAQIFGLAGELTRAATPQPSGNTGELAPRATADVERLRNLSNRLREHNDPRLYHEADALMSEAADAIDRATKGAKP